MKDPLQNFKDNHKNLHQFFKYATIGATATIIDLSGLYIFVEYANFSVIPAAVLSFLIANITSFLLNKNWTFQNTSKNYRKQYIKFLIVSLGGLLLTVGFMSVFVNIFKIWYMLAKILTSLVVMFWNFLGNKLWTFKLQNLFLQILNEFPFELSIVIPAYNEQNRIAKTLNAIENYVQQKNTKAEILVVSDGSDDNTNEVVEELSARIPNLKLLSYPKNRGKGFAVKTGIKNSHGRYILITDADNSTPIEEYEKLLKTLKQTDSQIAIGSRYLKDSDIQIKQPKYRILLGRLGNRLIQFFLLEGIQDTQCGFKLFENKCAKEIFAMQKIHRFGFDMEALVIAKTLGYKVIEVPVSWLNSEGSRVRPIKDGLITLKDLIYIKLNLLSGRYNNEQFK